MTAQTCPACAGRSTDGMLCHTCTRRTRKALRQIAEWWPTLEETITRQARLRANESSGAVFRPLPFEADASRLADEIHNDLVGWIRIALEVGAPHPEQGATPALALHLAAHMDALRHHKAADSLPTVDDWARAIRRAVDYPDERGRILVGPCPEKDADAEPCPGVIWARFFEEGQRPTMTCERAQPTDAETCGRVWHAEHFREASGKILARMEELRRQRDLAAQYAPKTPAEPEPPAPLPMGSIIPLVSVPDAAVIYGIPEGTIWRWLTERKLWPFGLRSARLVSAWQVADLGKKHRRWPEPANGEPRQEGPRDPVAARTLGSGGAA